MTKTRGGHSNLLLPISRQMMTSHTTSNGLAEPAVSVEQLRMWANVGGSGTASLWGTCAAVRGRCGHSAAAARHRGADGEVAEQRPEALRVLERLRHDVGVRGPAPAAEAVVRRHDARAGAADAGHAEGYIVEIHEGRRRGGTAGVRRERGALADGSRSERA